MDILNIILINTYSLSQLKHRVSRLKSYLEKQIFGSTTPIDPPLLDWIKTLPPNFLANFNKDNLQANFDEIQKKIASLEILTIYLTFDPDEQTLSLLGEQVRKNFGRIVLLDIKYDPNLIAGAALVWKGVYKDYSLRSKINERKGEILSSFQQFLR